MTGAPGSSTYAMWWSVAKRATQHHGEVRKIIYFAADFSSLPPLR
ncbi:hypothetical protein CORMATOL_01006 [Corynebacterium matruchotii ATCC 33806]|uniref:Uncharacterized protein n=2 Tax=Corynebacterium matruchotii TaxID=43768 RepID=E0DBN9_9CORY|nr:hypothetical protein CORMATOL_01006 [Corynebacterium matruchotii ATCC 33806]EFM50234.1 hypothetical protein HMPREF0299_5726 [Corynebacterium matruchotii ATCC 14266]